MTQNSFNTLTTITSGTTTYTIHDVSVLPQSKALPFSIRVLLENLLRNEDGRTVTKKSIEDLANWQADAEPSQEIAYRPARVLMQDFTGVPGLVDLAAMRDTITSMNGNPDVISPLQPADLVIDHSVQVDTYGNAKSLADNTRIEFERNRERYEFLKWGQKAFRNFRVIPPGSGIVHQVNIEYLSSVAFRAAKDGRDWVYPDTVVGTDSHTTMVNGLGVLGWGVGGIEAEAVMLGQPISMLVPRVVGFRLDGSLQAGVTATDMVLAVVEVLRKHGVVGKFVEFYGEGMQSLSVADRATIGNMAPEYGATCGIFPVDEQTLRYLSLTGRNDEQVELVETYYRKIGMFGATSKATYSENISLDLATVVPSLAGPKRPQDRVNLEDLGDVFRRTLQETEQREPKATAIDISQQKTKIHDGAVVLAAITSCTNTSNPSVLLGAGLLARNALQKGLSVKPWVKTSLAPGSRVVTRYLKDSGLLEELEKLSFYIVGYGCTTCIGNSGPLPEAVSNAIREGNLSVASVLSGNRNFEGRVHPEIKMNFLASPPLVVAYAIAGTVNINLASDPLGEDAHGNPVYLRDIWPNNEELNKLLVKLNKEQFISSYSQLLDGDKNWKSIDVDQGTFYTWNEDSSYVRKPPFFDNIDKPIESIEHIEGARVLALFGDSVTTDHISPAGAIKSDSPAGDYLKSLGIPVAQFNSYGSRRGNHEVMMRGTFANIRLRNLLVPGTEGGVTVHMPDDKQMSIFAASMQYKKENTPAIVIAGKEYGTGSSRDWAAKGPLLLGVRAVIAQSFERIHRTNLVGVGILPLQFADGESASSLGLTGRELFTISGINSGKSRQVQVTATGENSTVQFTVTVRIDTPNEIEYYRHGGILRYVLKQLAA